MQSATRAGDNAVEIDVTNPAVKWRYACPYEHRTYEPTNGGIWCRYCDLDDDIPKAHHTEVLDTRDGELIDFERVILLKGEKRWV